MIPKPYIAKWKDHALWNSFEQDQHFLMDIEGLIRAGIKYNQKEAFEWIKDTLRIKLR